MRQLLFAPIPLCDESPLSLIKRTAIRHGYTSVDQFNAHYLPKIKNSNKVLIRNSALSISLAEAAPEYSELIQSGFYLPSTNLVMHPGAIINNILVPPNMLRVAQYPLCTACIEEGWERSFANLRLTEVCPYHLKKYLSNCTQCHRRLSWRTQLTLTCKCGAILCSPDCSQDEASPELGLLQIFKEESQTRFFNILENLKVFAQPRLIHKVPDFRNIAAAAISVSTEDAALISRWIPSVFTQRCGYSEDIIRVLLSQLRPKLTNMDDLVQRTIQKIKSSNIAQNTLEASLTTNQVMNLLETNISTWLQLRKQPGFPLHTNPIKPYSATEIKLIERIYNGYERTSITSSKFLKFSEAASITGSPPACLRSAIKAGLIKVSHINRHAYIEETCITHFNNTYIPSSTLAKKLGKPTQTINRLIKSLKIDPVFSDKYTTIITKSDAASIKNLLETMQPPSKESSKRSAKLPKLEKPYDQDYLPFREACNLISLDSSTLLHLIHASIINAPYKGHNGTYLILRNEIENFHQKYIFSKEIAEIAGVPQCNVSRLLLRHNIKPVMTYNPELNHAVRTLFNRDEISEKIIESIKPDNTQSKSITLQSAAKELQLDRFAFSRIRALLDIKPHLNRLSPTDLLSIKSFINSLSPLSQVASALKINLHTLSCRFIRTKFTHPVRINGRIYFTEDDFHKMKLITESFCTCREADRIFNARFGYTYSQVKRGTLNKQTPHPSLTSIILIKRSDIALHNPCKYYST